MGSPLISVLVPSFNCERTISRTISSILGQSLSDLEVVVVDDGSTDGTVDVLRRIRDRRLRIIESNQNRGVAVTRNALIEESTGIFLAWIDADDWSHHRRLEWQVRQLEKTRSSFLCASWVGTYSFLKRHGFSDGAQRSIRTSRRLHFGSSALKPALLFGNAMALSGTVMRASEIRNSRVRFQEDLLGAEDYQFWVDAEHLGNYTLVERVLTCRQELRSGLSAQHHESMLEHGRQIQRKLLEAWGLEPSQGQLCAQDLLSGVAIPDSEQSVQQAIAWGNYLLSINKKLPRYDSRGLTEVVASRLIKVIVLGLKYGHFSTYPPAGTRHFGDVKNFAVWALGDLSRELKWLGGARTMIGLRH